MLKILPRVLADTLVKLVALQPIQFYCLRVGEHVHAARDHTGERLLDFAVEVGRPVCTGESFWMSTTSVKSAAR